MANFNRWSSAEEVSRGFDLSGHHSVVTGANTGIGLETARVLALRGSSVTMACRNLEKADHARSRVLEESGGQIASELLEVRELDLASLQSIRRFAAGFLESGRPLQLLVNNAGVMLPHRRETSDGFEAHLGINHLGHFLLTCLLRSALEASAPSRVVCVASDALAFAALDGKFEDLNWEKRRYSGMRSYGDSKLMNAMFAVELTRRMKDTRVVANALHPGVVTTELARDQPWWMAMVGLLMQPAMKNVARGAATSVYVATAPAYADRGGLYFANSAEKSTPKLANDPDACARLWQISEDLTGLTANTG